MDLCYPTAKKLPIMLQTQHDKLLGNNFPALCLHTEGDGSAETTPTIYKETNAGLIPGLCPANERLRYFVTMSLIGWVQT